MRYMILHKESQYRREAKVLYIVCLKVHAEVPRMYNIN